MTELAMQTSSTIAHWTEHNRGTGCQTACAQSYSGPNLQELPPRHPTIRSWYALRAVRPCLGVIYWRLSVCFPSLPCSGNGDRLPYLPFTTLSQVQKDTATGKMDGVVSQPAIVRVGGLHRGIIFPRLTRAHGDKGSQGAPFSHCRSHIVNA